MRSSVVRLGVLLLAFLAAPPAGAVARNASPSRARALRLTLQRDLNRVGGASGAYVIDLTIHRVLFSKHVDVGRLPASIQKLYTTSTALLRFGASGQLTTS